MITNLFWIINLKHLILFINLGKILNKCIGVNLFVSINNNIFVKNSGKKN